MNNIKIQKCISNCLRKRNMKSCIKVFKKENSCVKIITRSEVTGKFAWDERWYGIVIDVIEVFI